MIRALEIKFWIFSKHCFHRFDPDKHVLKLFNTVESVGTLTGGELLIIFTKNVLK
jgi:hypothetical protein